MTPEELKEIEDRLQHAPDPLRIVTGEFTLNGDVLYRFSGLKEMNAGHAKFLSHAPEDIKALLSHIKELESQIPRWIPVSEKMPEYEGIFLVYYLNNGIGQVNYAFYNKREGGFEDPDGFLYGVTHWMPLPPGPEEG